MTPRQRAKLDRLTDHHIKMCRCRAAYYDSPAYKQAYNAAYKKRFGAFPSDRDASVHLEEAVSQAKAALDHYQCVVLYSFHYLKPPEPPEIQTN